MHFLYLDDSGSVGNANEEYFVLAGVCIPESSVRWLSRELERLAESVYPDDPAFEFHAAEIFGGKTTPWDTFFDKRRRVEIIKNVLLVLKRAFSDTTIFACAIHKLSFPREDPVLMAYEHISGKFNLHLEQLGNDQLGLIILDNSSYETGLQNLAKNVRQVGNRWGFQLHRIIEVPLFVDSRASRIIQLADHVAYAIFRRYNSGDLTYFNCIEDRFYEKDGVMHGLIHRHDKARTCTCPACLNKRDRPQYA